jgi:hypothetical protein
MYLYGYSFHYISVPLLILTVRIAHNVASASFVNRKLKVLSNENKHGSKVVSIDSL